MGDLTKHFSTAEFAVSESYPQEAAKILFSKHDVFKAHLLATLYGEPVRAYISSVEGVECGLRVLSGKRSEALNALVGGAEDSDHLFRNECAAFDITFLTNTRERVFLAYKFLANSPTMFGQLIYYPEKNFIHVSIPSKKHFGECLVKTGGSFTMATNTREASA